MVLGFYPGTPGLEELWSGARSGYPGVQANSIGRSSWTGLSQKHLNVILNGVKNLRLKHRDLSHCSE
jgi:hypothetical protein